jgi:hypothetical protein
MSALEDFVEIEEIKKLRVLYSHYFDGGEMDKLAELFTKDAVCAFGQRFGGDWVGRDEIRDRYARVHRPGMPTFAFLHAVTNQWVELTGTDTAHGRCYLIDLITVPAEGEGPLTLLGIYDDDYQKIEGRWYISRTRIDFVWPERNVLGEHE